MLTPTLPVSNDPQVLKTRLNEIFRVIFAELQSIRELIPEDYMAIKISKRLVDGSQLTTGAATYYTTPANTRTKIEACVLTNTSGANRTVTMHLVPSGGSASASNRILSAYTVNAGASYSVDEAINQVLETGGTLQALSDGATAVSLVASGSEYFTRPS